MPVVNIADLRDLARRRLPRMFFDMMDGAAHDEVTARANRADFERIRFRPRVMVDVEHIDLKTNILGTDLSLPLLLTPLGGQGVLARRGELQSAAAAERCGITMCLSTGSNCSIEDLRASTKRPFWFQLIIRKDKGLAKALVDRARDAGCSALILSVDMAILGQRERDLRNGFSIPPKITIWNALEMLLHFDWMTDVLLGPKLTLGNLDPEKNKSLEEVAKLMATQINPGVTWKDVDWMRSVWNGPLILKGILTPEDARLAVRHGADAISVSNHGGRKLDGSPSSISALPAIVDEVGDRTTVLMDGGVRRGHDVVKALALGAKGCLIGRAFAYGLGAMGGAGVEKAIRILEGEMREVMRGLGRSSIAELDRDCLMEVPFVRSSSPRQTVRTAAHHEVEN